MEATTEKMVRVLQGNEACAEGALAAGVRFFAGYPITPSSEIAEIMSRRLPLMGGHFIQMEDELASMAAIIGASLTGVRSMTATSGPGFSLMQENLGFGCIAEIPCLVVNVQRGGPSTGLPTQVSQMDIMQARWGTHGDHAIIALAPASVLECFEMTVACVSLGEEYRTPTVLLMDEVLGHMREDVVLPDPEACEVCSRLMPDEDEIDYCPYESNERNISPLAPFSGAHRFHVTGLTHDRHGFPTMVPEEVDAKIRGIVNKIELHADDLALYEEFMVDDCEVLLFAYGSTARVAKSSVRALRERGVKAGLLRAKVIWPFSGKRLRELAKHASLVVVPEMNMGQLVTEVERAVCGAVRVVKESRVDGSLFVPAEITDFVEKEMGR